MIEFVHGDLFASGAEALVNPVNCVGVMGAGLALQFKSRYARMYVEYKHACGRGLLKPGSVLPVKVDDDNGKTKWVLNLPTKDHWKDPSKMEYVSSGLIDLHRAIHSIGLKSVAMPAIGCGLGGLPWPRVKTMISQLLGDLDDVRILVYEPVARKTAPHA